MAKILNLLRSRNVDLLQFSIIAIENLSGIKHSDKLKKASNIRKIYNSGFKNIADIKRSKLIIFNTALQEADYKQSYITSIFSTLSVVCREAVKEGYLLKNPVLQLRLVKKKDREPIRYLTTDSFKKIEAASFSNKLLQFVADLYIFQLETGLSYADLVSVTTENIEVINNANWLVGRRVKTGIEYFIPLSTRALNIIEKYGSVLVISRIHKKDKELLFPSISICRYNVLLKEVAKELDIKENITSHRARHTFATLMLEQGVSMEAISKILGHSRPLMTEHYSRVTINKIDNEIKKQNFFKF